MTDMLMMKRLQMKNESDKKRLQMKNESINIFFFAKILANINK